MGTKKQSTSDRVATRFINAMAYPRKEFKNKVQSKLTGAILEFYKARAATKNDQTRWVTHWMTEVKRLVENELVAEIFHPVSGFKDRRKAYKEAVDAFREGDKGYRKYAESTVCKDFNLRKLKRVLDHEDTEAFWAYVETFTDRALESLED